MREPPPLPLLVQQASFSSQWPPAQAYQPGQQSGVNAPSTPIVSELMKCSLPVPSHSMTTRQMTNGNVLNGYRHTRGVKSQSHSPCWRRGRGPATAIPAAVDALLTSTLGSIWNPSSTTLHTGEGVLYWNGWFSDGGGRVRAWECFPLRKWKVGL